MAPSNKQRKNVGVIGLGIIGTRVAAGLRHAGFHACVWNRTPKPAPNFLGSPVEVAQECEVIQLFVADARAVMETIEALSPLLTPQHLIVCNATIGLEGTLAAAARVRELGARFLDAPFTGSKGAADKRELVYYLGGEEQDFVRARPILEATSKAIIPIGEVGQAAVVKVVTNLISAATVQTLAEALAIVRASGIRPEALGDAIAANAMRSGVTDLKLPAMIAADYAPHFSLKHMFKDVQLGIELANKLELDVPATSTVGGVLYGAVMKGLGDLDYAALAKAYDNHSGAARIAPAEMNAPAEPVPTAEEYRAFREHGGVVDLSSRVKLLFTGADRVRYLNGQLTANMAAAKNPSVFPACVTTAKGRMCADVWVSIAAESVLVDAEALVAGTLPARLERYIIADEVTMEDVSEKMALVHFAGMKMDDVPAEIRGALVPANRFGIAGHDWLSPFRNDLAPMWEKIAERCPPLSDGLAELLRIEHGVPRWGRELDENTLPHEAGLDRTHVDFHKGCYIGQEVISRLRSVGHVNRELRGFVSADGAPLAAGARIFSAADPAREVGRLTSAAFSFALDRPIALGYLRRDAGSGEFLAAGLDAPAAPVRIALHPLPFVP